jgi:uncharacterized protein YcaQ
MRRLVHMTGKASNSPFERGLVSLQRDFKILPVGVAQAGAWRYSFIFDLVHRYYPELPEQARPILRSEARMVLVERYLKSVGAATTGDTRKMFQWPRADIDRTVDRLVQEGRLESGYQVKGASGDHLVATQLLSFIER